MNFIRSFMDFLSIVTNFKTELPLLGPTNCLDHNTAYYGYNIQIVNTNGNSSDCQRRCQRRHRCKFWSFNKYNGRCHLKTRKDGEPAYVKIHGPVYPGNNYIYVSGSKYCTHVSISFSTSYPRLYTSKQGHLVLLIIYIQCMQAGIRRE